MSRNQPPVADLPTLTSARLPPRSTLYALEPKGLGTADCESLAGYLFRLSLAHCLSALDLAWYVIRDVLSGPAVTLKESMQPWRERLLSGVSDTPRRWANALQLLTTVGRLDYLTLAPWSDVLSPRSLIAPQERWCPACFEDARINGTAPHLRLLWDIAAVEACPAHGVVLATCCPRCNASFQRAKVACPIPGYCHSCGAWLGASGDSFVQATAEQIRAAEQVGALIAAGPERAAGASSSAMRAVLRAGTDGVFSGNAAALGHAIGSRRTRFTCGWHARRYRLWRARSR